MGWQGLSSRRPAGLLVVEEHAHDAQVARLVVVAGEVKVAIGRGAVGGQPVEHLTQVNLRPAALVGADDDVAPATVYGVAGSDDEPPAARVGGDAQAAHHPPPVAIAVERQPVAGPTHQGVRCRIVENLGPARGSAAAASGRG